jgi:hypothetical protein
MHLRILFRNSQAQIKDHSFVAAVNPVGVSER